MNAPVKPTSTEDSIRSIDVRLIDSYHEFTNLQANWNNLVVKTTASHPVFLRHEWFDAAWQWRKQSDQLFILAVYKNDLLIGIFPGCLRSGTRHGINIRILGFLDVPDTQFCELIADPSYIQVVTSALASHLKGIKSNWDMLELEHIQQNSPVHRHFSSALEQLKIHCHLVDSGRNLAINVATNWVDYYKTRSRRLKKGNNLIANKLKRTGDIDISWLRSSNDALQAIPSVIDISSKSWKTETGKTLDNQGPGDFIRRLSQHAEKNGWLSIWMLTLDDETIAVEYQLIDNGNIYALRADYDSKFSDLSPGSYLNWKLLERLFDHELNTYYLGPGENKYKHRWTEDGEALVTAVGYGKTLKGRVLKIMEQNIRPIVKYLRKYRQKQT